MPNRDSCPHLWRVHHPTTLPAYPLSAESQQNISIPRQTYLVQKIHFTSHIAPLQKRAYDSAKFRSRWHEMLNLADIFLPYPTRCGEDEHPLGEVVKLQLLPTEEDLRMHANVKVDAGAIEAFPAMRHKGGLSEKEDLPASAPPENALAAFNNVSMHELDNEVGHFLLPSSPLSRRLLISISNFGPISVFVYMCCGITYTHRL